MKVLYFGTYSMGEGYPRNRVIIQGLKENAVDVVECNVNIWRNADEKMKGVKTVAGTIFAVFRIIRAYISLMFKFFKAKDYDLIIVGYTGQVDVFLAKFLNLFRKKPVVLDAFLSLYDTIITDRGLVSPGSVRARVVWWLDRKSCRLADLVLLDTEEHIKFFVREFGIDRSKFVRVFVGAEEIPEGARVGARCNVPVLKRQENEIFEVLYFGTYLPLHGVEYIIKASRLLEDKKDIRFTMIGKGQLLEEAKKLASDNVEFVDRWISPSELGSYILRADVCLGVFGDTDKAKRVIPCKVYDCMGMGKPIITGDTPAIRELLTHGDTAILSPVAHPASIAEAVLRLKADKTLCEAIGKRAERLYQKRCSSKAIGRELKPHLARLLS